MFIQLVTLLTFSVLHYFTNIADTLRSPTNYEIAVFTRRE